MELLRVLQDGSPVPMREVTTRLRLAPSTVSNLVRNLSGSGLVKRRASGTDLRSAELVASPKALTLLGRYDEASRTAVHDALAELNAADRKAVENALPALQRLVASLENPEREG